MFTCSVWNLSVPQSNSWKRLAAFLVQSVYHRFDYGSLRWGPPTTGLVAEEPCSTVEHARWDHTDPAEAQRIHCVNAGGLEEGRALQETVIHKKSAPKWLLSPHRYRVSERVRRSGAHGLSKLPHTEHRQGNVMKVRDTHRLETLWDVSQVLAECWCGGGAATFIDGKRGHNKGITCYYLITESFNRGLLLVFTCSPEEKEAHDHGKDLSHHENGRRRWGGFDWAALLKLVKLIFIWRLKGRKVRLQNAP